jgi:demethylmenaquinone methyltransferase/2-methoxy-6-polyprenyl-1,4-benzoquinol methylase
MPFIAKEIRVSKDNQTPLTEKTWREPDASRVQDLFGSIAETYDVANDVMTLGLARLWRKKLVSWSRAKSGDKILDCATGTGDLALEFKKTVGTSGTVIGTDFCQEMLDKAPAKAKAQNLDVKFEWADAMALPYQDETFDVVSIAYGIRNVADVNKALSEMSRVLKPGGRLMILETGEIQNPVLRVGIRFYFEKFVPRLGGWVSGRRDAYEYLQRSSGGFPSGRQFCDILQAMKSGDHATFSSVEFRTLMGGASYIYRAEKSI